MSEPKTQPTDASVEEFLDSAATSRRREEGHRLDEIFREVTGAEPVMWGPSIVGYGSHLYVADGTPGGSGVWPKAGFSPRKAKLSLYWLKDQPAGAELLPQLGKFKDSMGCVYVNKLEDIDLDVLRRLVAIAWDRG